MSDQAEWVRVPRELTEAMIRAYWSTPDMALSRVWAAMLAAAPTAGRHAMSTAREAIAQALLDRFIDRGLQRGQAPFRPGTKLAQLPSSYLDDFVQDADDCLRALSTAVPADVEAVAQRLRSNYDAWNHPGSEGLPEDAGCVLDAATLILAQAAQLAEANIEVDHFGKLAFVDLGANPPVAWKDRAEAAEAESAKLHAAASKVVADYDACSGAEPSLSALHRSIDTDLRAALNGGKDG